MGSNRSWGALAIFVVALLAIALGATGVFGAQKLQDLQPALVFNDAPPDRDGDGWPDSVDECPDEVGDEVSGCPQDTDRDVPFYSPPPVTDGEVKSDIGTNFSPQPDYEQSCEPQRRDGCTWDVGARQILWNEALQRSVNQVGIVKGVRIEWNGMVARALRASDGKNRCSIVVIPGTTDGSWLDGNWLENLTVWDANVTTYYVWAGDPEGWMQTLAVQAAQEQSANYGCPLRNWPEDFDIWTSGISSPPCGVEGFDCVGPGGGTEDTSSNQQQDTQPNDTEPDVSNPGANPGGNGNQANCAADTVDCKPRKATRDYGGKLSFKKGAAVMGFKVVIGGKNYGTCYTPEAWANGYVIDGAVHYWEQERIDQHLRACA